MFLQIEAIVMNYRWLAGQNLDGRDPRVFFERSWDCQLFPFFNAARGNRIRRKFNDDVGLNLPSVRRPLNRSRRILSIAFLGSAINPADDRFDFRPL